MGNTSFWKETGVRFASGGDEASFFGGGSEFFGGGEFLGSGDGDGGGTLMATSFFEGDVGDPAVLPEVPEKASLSLPLGKVDAEPGLEDGSLFFNFSPLLDIAGVFSVRFAFDSALACTIMDAR